MDQELNKRTVVLEFQMAGNGEADAEVLRLASLLPRFARQEGGRKGRLRLNLPDAGVFRDVLFDLWKLVKDRSANSEDIQPGETIERHMDLEAESQSWTLAHRSVTSNPGRTHMTFELVNPHDPALIDAPSSAVAGRSRFNARHLRQLAPNQL